MKRSVCIICLIISLVPLFGQSGYILTSSGAVWIENTGGKSGASSGTIIEAGDTVVTGPDGYVDLLLDNDQPVKLEPNSRFFLDGGNTTRDGVFGKIMKGMWAVVAGKFSDTEYSTAAVGTVGAIRGNADLRIEDFEMTEDEATQFDELLKVIHPDADAAYTESQILLLGPMMESFFQFASAEKLYLAGIESFPHAGIIYDLLIDLYMNNELYKDAQQVYQQREARIGG